MSTLSSPFAGLNSVFLIGGGDLMLHAARAFQKHKLEVVAVFAPRHADEILPIDGRRTRDAFHEQGVTIKIVERMLPDGAWTEFLTDPGRTVALCFGPAWIFSDSVQIGRAHV